MERLIRSGETRISGTGAEPVKGRAVVVEDGRIKAVIPEGRHPADATVLPLGGLTLLPGLINCHVHFCLGGAPDPPKVLFEDAPPPPAIKAVPRARQTVE